MNTMMMAERMGMAGMGVPGAPPMGMNLPAAMPVGMNMVMVPRCTIRFEKCPGGMRMVCACEDRAAAGALQNLCAMMGNGMCGCCAMMNGMMVCCCNMPMPMCQCQETPEGVTMVCTSGDSKCCDMIQGCCDCMNCMMQAGCMCCVLLNNMPVCCCMA